MSSQDYFGDFSWWLLNNLEWLVLTAAVVVIAIVFYRILFRELRTLKGDLRREAGFAYFQTFVQHLPTGVLLEAADRTVLSVNNTFCQLLTPSADPEQYLKKNSLELYEKAGRTLGNIDVFYRRMTDLVSGGEVVQGEEIRLANGRVLQRDYFPVVSNGFTAHLWHYRDVTEREQFDKHSQRRDLLMAEAQRIVHLGSWDWDIPTNTVTWSDELYRICGLTHQEVEPTYEAFLERVHPSDRLLVRTAIEKAYSDHQSFTLSHRMLGSNGSVRTLHARGIVIENGEGKPIRMVWTGLDVTDELAIEEALKHSRQRYNELVSSVDGIVWEANTSLDMTFVSKQSEHMLGYPVELWTHEPMFWQNHIVPVDRDMVAKRLQKVVEEGGHDGIEFRMVAADGRTVWLRCSVYGISEESGNKLRGIMVDVTERKNVESRLKESFEQLRNLAVRLQSIREEESTRIALEIHDELGQSLTGLKMDLTWMVKKLPKDQHELLEKISSMLKLVDSTIHTVRKISTELRPGVLDDLGLVAALEWQADEFERRTGIRCNLSLPEDSLIQDRDRSTAVFRVFQETLTNIARHANAKSVTVTMRHDNDNVYLEVRDDGVGIPIQKINDPRSMGLIGMRERAVFLGGRLNITSQPMQGSIVTLQVPLSQK